jgi:outer membrane protein assembly factor BamB
MTRRIVGLAAAACALALQAHAADWPTFAGSAQRLGVNTGETVLTAATVPGMTLHWSRSLAGATSTQPLYIEAVATAKHGTHDVVFAATRAGEIAAINALTGAFDWHLRLPITTRQAGSCVAPGMGVTGTPTIDPVAGILYVVDGLGYLHALAIGTGAEQPGYPVQVIDSVDAGNGSFNHSSPTMVGTLLFITTSGDNPCEKARAPYHGAVIAFDTVAKAVVNTYFSVPAVTGGGGIWGPGGVLWDPVTNALFAGTGNSLARPSTMQDAEALVMLDTLGNRITATSPGMPWLTPLGDFDFASTPTPIDVPGCPPLLALLNKTGYMFVYNRANIGGGPVQVLSVSSGGGESSFVGMAAFDAATQMLFINNPVASIGGGINNGGVAFSIAAPACTLTLAWQTVYGFDVTTYKTVATDPVVAGGVVWFVTGAGASVLALNEITGAPLWTSGTTLHAVTNTPVTVMDGQMFVQSGSVLYAFGL